MEIDNIIIHFRPGFKLLPIECNLRVGKKIVARVARRDLETLNKWLRETDLYKLPYKVITHYEYEMEENK